MLMANPQKVEVCTNYNRNKENKKICIHNNSNHKIKLLKYRFYSSLKKFYVTNIFLIL